jgi:uncharacterized protein
MAPVSSNTKPWYREPWPWLLMLGPAVAVIGGIVMTALALHSEDGLVADDYYNQGLAINRTLERDSRARALGLRAEITLNPERKRVEATLSGSKQAVLPLKLRLRIAHPTKAGLDRVIVLEGESAGRYRAAMPALPHGRWLLTLEDHERTWRLNTEWRAGDAAVIMSAVN